MNEPMTEERLEEIGSRRWSLDIPYLVAEVRRLREELHLRVEVTQQFAKPPDLWECTDCGFRMAADHVTEHMDEWPNCPCCSEQALLKEVQQLREQGQALAEAGAAMALHDGDCEEPWRSGTCSCPIVAFNAALAAWNELRGKQEAPDA